MNQNRKQESDPPKNIALRIGILKFFKTFFKHMFTKTPLKTPFKNMGFFQNNLKTELNNLFIVQNRD